MSIHNKTEKLVLDVDVASTLKAALCAARWNAGQVDAIAQGKYLREFRSVIDGFAEIRPRTFKVDLGAPPPPLKGLDIKSAVHRCWVEGVATITREGDKLFVDGKRILLFVWKGQRRGCISGEIERALRGRKVLNVNFAKFLFNHRFMIPGPWYRFGTIFFWDTTYTNAINEDYVATLQMPHISDMSLWCEHINRTNAGGGITTDSASAILEL